MVKKMKSANKEYQDFVDAFRGKLRTATVDHSSISALCREAGINRQQFNKYLDGSSLPSLYNLHKICSKLGIRIDDLVESDLQVDGSTGDFHRRVKSVGQQSMLAVTPGWYLEVSKSDVLDDHILVSLCKLMEMKNSQHEYRRMMPGQVLNPPKRKFYQYLGLAIKTSNTIDIRYLNLFAVNFNSTNVGYYKLVHTSLSGPDMIGVKTAVDSKLPWRGLPFSSAVYFKFLGEKLQLSDARAYVRVFQIGEEPEFIRAQYAEIQTAFESYGDHISM